MDEKTKIIDKAQKLVQKGYLDKAIAEYKRVVEKDPKDATIRLRIGDLYVKIGKKDEAIKEYSEVAKHHTQKGFYLKAIAVYKQILKLDEGQMEIHFKLADLYTKQKLMADAVASLSVLMGFYEKKGKLDEALDVLKKMIAVDPQNVGVRLKLAESYKKKGFTNDALVEYGEAFKSLLKDGKFDKAEKLYQELYGTYKKDINIVSGLAEVYKAKGDNTKLIKYYKELTSLYKEKGENEKGKEIYEKILAISPDDNDALNALGKKAAVPEVSPKPAPSQIPSEKEPAKESLIAWPEFTKDLFEEPQVEPEKQVSAPAELKEEPIISWNEMVEVTEEPEKRPIVQPQEPPVSAKPKEAVPVVTEEAPLIEMPEIHAVEAKEEAPILEVKESAPSAQEIHEEAAVEEITPGYLEPVEEPLSMEEAEAVVPAAPKSASKHGLEGLEGFLPEGATVVGVTESSQEEGYVDLSSELGLEEALDFLTESWAPDEKSKETFTEFKHGVEKQLSKEDSETHYNLGVAYMEMELYDDAMREFRVALKDPVFEFDCYTRLGLSFMAKADYQEAIAQFLKGLKVSGRTDVERKGLMYELGLAYEAAGSMHEALEVFKSIYETDKGFREVASKVKELSKKSKKEVGAENIPLMDDMLEIELL